MGFTTGDTIGAFTVVGGTLNRDPLQTYSHGVFTHSLGFTVIVSLQPKIGYGSETVVSLCSECHGTTLRSPYCCERPTLNGKPVYIRDEFFAYNFQWYPRLGAEESLLKSRFYTALADAYSPYEIILVVADLLMLVEAVEAHGEKFGAA